MVGVPPTVTVGAVVTVGKLPFTTCGCWPAGTTGSVAPKPVTQSVRISPAFAANVPGTTAGLPMKALSGFRVI